MKKLSLALTVLAFGVCTTGSVAQKGIKKEKAPQPSAPQVLVDLKAPCLPPPPPPPPVPGTISEPPAPPPPPVMIDIQSPEAPTPPPPPAVPVIEEVDVVES